MLQINPIQRENSVVVEDPVLNPGHEHHYRKKVLALILLATCIRGLLAFTIELGNDESYYWLYSQNLQWNYFDHPPVIAFWIRFFTLNSLLDGIPGFIRLGSVLGCAAATWAIYRTVALIYSERAGWFAACLYSASFYTGLIAGLFMWPDAPQMVFWTFSLWMIARIFRNDRDWKSWILLGIGVGLCIMSKVHGIFIWVGFGAYILFFRRTWLARPQVYVAVLLSVIIASPILIWNMQHDFITWKFHSERVTIKKETSLHGDSFSREVLGQFLLNNPFNVLMIFAALKAWSKKRMNRHGALSVFLFIGMPLIVILIFVSAFRDTYAHWSGPAYVSLIPITAVYLAGRESRSLFPWLLRWSLVGFLAFIIGWQALHYLYPGTWGNKQEQVMGRGDISLDTHGWEEAGRKFAAYVREEKAKGTIPQRAPIIAYKWWGAHIEYYFARTTGMTMIGLGQPHDAHHYLWTNTWRQHEADMQTAYCIVPSDEFYNVTEKYGQYYSRIDQVTSIQSTRMGQPSHRFHIYRLSGWKGVVPVLP